MVTYAFLREKVKTVDFSETIAACDLKFGRCTLFVLCFTRSRYQVSVYRTNGPLVLCLIVRLSLLRKTILIPEYLAFMCVCVFVDGCISQF